MLRRGDSHDGALLYVVHCNATTLRPQDKNVIDSEILLQYNVGMPKDKAKQALSRPLQIRVSEDLLELLRKAAERDRRSVSNWARDRLEKAAERELRGGN